MRIVILDYAGHLPQADLAKKISLLNNEVLHLYCTDYVTGTADFSKSVEFNSNLEYRGVSTGLELKRYRITSRINHEIKISRILSKQIQNFNPEFVIMSNVPLLSAVMLVKVFKKLKIKYIFWWQDVYSLAIRKEILKRVNFPFVGIFLNPLYVLEKYLLSNAHSVVAISEKFRELYVDWNLDLSKFNVYPNWSPPEDFEFDPHESDFLNFPYVLYAGTLGLKHNPSILIGFADLLREYKSEIRLVVVSEGLGREYLHKLENNRENVILMDFLPLNQFKLLLQNAITTLTILENSASEYSVPSKVMTYFAAGKSMIAFVSKENQAAQFITSSNAGYVAEDGQYAEAVRFAINLSENDFARQKMENNARAFAIENFSGMRAATLFSGLMQSESN